MPRAGRPVHLALSAALALAAAAPLASGGCSVVVGADFDDKWERTCDACYGGPEATLGRGACKSGCSFEGVCAGEVTPQAEDCATLDDDESCDGVNACDGAPALAGGFGDGADQTDAHVARDHGGNVLLASSAQGVVTYGACAPAGTPPIDPAEYDVHLAKLDASGACLWALGFGDDDGYEYVRGVAVDPSDNVILAGQFNNSFRLGGDELSSAGDADLFVAKYDPSGAHIWSQRFGGTAADAATHVAVDQDGFIVVGGYFDASFEFGVQTVTSAGGPDAFLARIDPGGAVLWVQTFGGADDQVVDSVATGPGGAIVMTGHFRGTTTIGGVELTNLDGDFDTFVVVFDRDGKANWGRHYQGNIVPSAVSMGANGDYAVAGSLAGTADLTDGPLVAVDGVDAFVVAYGPGGAYRWSKVLHGPGAQVANAVGVDGRGNVLVGGYAETSIDFGAGAEPGAGGADVFLAKLTPQGELAWRRRFGDGAAQAVTDLVVDPIGNAVVGGHYDGAMAIGDALLGAQARDVWVATLRP